MIFVDADSLVDIIFRDIVKTCPNRHTVFLSLTCLRFEASMINADVLRFHCSHSRVISSRSGITRCCGSCGMEPYDW